MIGLNSLIGQVELLPGHWYLNQARDWLAAVLLKSCVESLIEPQKNLLPQLQAYMYAALRIIISKAARMVTG